MNSWTAILAFIHKFINPALKIVLAVNSLACLTLSSNASEAASQVLMQSMARSDF